jgi:hypothetical protein
MVLALGGSLALATDLNVTLKSGGSSSIQVPAGSVVNYEVVGELSDNLNEGLALVLVDLSFTGGPLTQANEPTELPMTNFDRPDGVTNPAGFGGTVIDGVVVQAGGSQNTIKNTVDNAPFPIGTVIMDVAAPGSPQVLLTGSLTAPMAAGTYMLTASNIQASVIRAGEDGTSPFWAVDLAGTGTVVNLSIEVVPEIEDPMVDAAGSRYLAISLGNRPTAIALFVTPQCPGATGKYVGAPSGVYNVARLVDDPQDAAFMTASQWTAAGSIVYVTGPDVIPDLTYMLETDIGTPGSPNLLPGVTARTWVYGELNNIPPVDVDDLVAIVRAFGGFFDYSTLYASDQEGADPIQEIDVDDITAVVAGFGGFPYPGSSPCP